MTKTCGSVGTAGIVVIVYVMIAGHPPPSVAWIPTVEAPASVGVPDSRPPAESVNPAGSVPLSTLKV